jgi:hypothetical protein
MWDILQYKPATSFQQVNATIKRGEGSTGEVEQLGDFPRLKET